MKNKFILGLFLMFGILVGISALVSAYPQNDAECAAACNEQYGGSGGGAMYGSGNCGCSVFFSGDKVGANVATFPTTPTRTGTSSSTSTIAKGPNMRGWDRVGDGVGGSACYMRKDSNKRALIRGRFLGNLFE